ncbi:MAG: leucine-rich repeat protein [Bacilli bacterium]|nr:leucine-rich repeat protein [Bacilli bacterium]
MCDHTCWNYNTSGVSNSIIDYISRRNCSVYYEKVFEDYYENLQYSYTVLTTVYDEDISDKSKINSINLNTSKSICVVLSPQKYDGSHQIYSYENDVPSKLVNKGVAYKEIETMVNYVIYKYMADDIASHTNDPTYQLTIPRINMIGHSRGGIVNMQYAIEHPDLVDLLFSIGTPYNGSTVYNYLYNLNSNVVDYLGDFSQNSIKDCVNPSSYQGLKHYWNTYQDGISEHKTKLYAIGGTMSIDLLRTIAYNYTTDSNDLIKKALFILNTFSLNPLVNNQPNVQIDKLASYTNMYIDKDITSYFTFLGGICNLYNWAVNYNTDPSNITEQQFYAMVVKTVIHLLAYMKFESQVNQYVMNNDILVDLNSQQADGYSNVIKFKKVFTSLNSDFNALAASTMPAVGHNLEPCDEDIINCILSNIEFGSDDHGFNIKMIDSDTYEYIGFNYEKAVDNGTLTFSKIMSEDEMIISSKMFDCDYTLAQKLFKNRYDNYWTSLKGTSTDGINHIHFQDKCTIDDNTFAFLKGQVKFTANNIYAPFIFNCESLDVYSLDSGSIYHNKKLLKHGMPGNTIVNNNTIENVEEIGVGAFLCQPIQNLTIDNSNCISIENLTIDNYAFYSCRRLESVNTATDIDYIGTYSFSHSKMHSGKKEVIINNALIKAKSDTPLYVNGNSTYDYIAPKALTNYQYNYVVIESDDITFASNSLSSNKLENIIIYTDSPIMNDYALGMHTPNIYSAYNLSGVFNNITIQNTIDITLLKPNEQPITKSLVLDTTYQDPNVIFTQNELSITGYNGLGYVINDDNVYYNEVMTSVNFFQYANEELHLYYECSVSHQSNITPTNHSYHIIECVNCMKKEKVDHTYVITEIIENNEIDDRCHQLTCNVCNATKEDFHTIQFGLIEINNELYYGRMCTECEFESPITHITVTDNGENHLLSNGEYLPHDYIPMEFQGYTIMMCKYCGHHVHNGLIGSSDGNSTHNLYCELCQTICHMPHVCDDYENQNNDLYDGYHRKKCTICNTYIFESHTYVVDDNYEDGHHLICTLCGATTTWSHDPVNSCNPTPYSHTEYCEFCQCYYYVSHTFQFYDIIESDSNGHYVQCETCGYIKQVSHINNVYYNDYGHYNHCSICGYEGSIVQHTPFFNCNSIDPHDHYMYCSGCGYTLATTLIYSVYHEYEHFCKCSICNVQIAEAHEENCVYYDDELHLYICYLCDVNYLMPHFVNDHVIIYENYEPGYDLWVCTYCGYMEVRRREE